MALVFKERPPIRLAEPFQGCFPLQTGYPDRAVLVFDYAARLCSQPDAFDAARAMGASAVVFAYNDVGLLNEIANAAPADPAGTLKSFVITKAGPGDVQCAGIGPWCDVNAVM